MIITKSPDEIAKMRKAGSVVAAAFQAVEGELRAGMTTAEIDGIVETVIRDAGCTPSFKGYRGFPASACVSVNEEIVHGIPGPRVLEDGDIVSIDIGAIHEGYHGDSAWTFAIGELPSEVAKLLQATEEAMWAGIAQARVGNRIGDISNAIQQVAEGAGFSLIREYGGHGVGQALHEDLQIMNFGPPGRGPKIVEGMTMALEPMVTLGDWPTAVLDDDWTVVTADGRLSAHYEHTIATTSGDPIILTTPA